MRLGEDVLVVVVLVVVAVDWGERQREREKRGGERDFEDEFDQTEQSSVPAELLLRLFGGEMPRFLFAFCFNIQIYVTSFLPEEQLVHTRRYADLPTVNIAQHWRVTQSHSVSDG